MSELGRLAKMLDIAGVPYELHRFSIGDMQTVQICSPNHENCVVDAVCHMYSYGGNEGFLEVMGSANPDCPNTDGVEGWLTAEGAFKYFVPRDPSIFHNRKVEDNK